MKEISPSLTSLKMRLEIMKLNHAEHNKFAIELHYPYGPHHPKIIELSKELGKMVDEMQKIQKQIEIFSQEKSATD